jgi:hypothetical protein
MVIREYHIDSPRIFHSPKPYFGPFTRRVEVKIFYIRAHESGIRGQNDTIEKNFGSGHVSGGGADIARIVNEVTANGEADAVAFRFLRADCGNDASIGHFAIGWHLVSSNEANGFRAGGHASANTLGKASESVVKSMNPFFFSWTMGKLVVFKGLASEGVQYGVGDMLEHGGRQREYGTSDGGNVVGTR